MDINKAIKLGFPLVIIGVVVSEAIGHILAVWAVDRLRERGMM